MDIDIDIVDCENSRWVLSQISLIFFASCTRRVKLLGRGPVSFQCNAGGQTQSAKVKKQLVFFGASKRRRSTKLAVLF